MPKIYELVTKDPNNCNLCTDFTEHEILQLVNLCYRRKYNMTLGSRLAKLYLVSKGSDGKKNLENMGIDIPSLERDYQKMKRLLGEVL